MTLCILVFSEVIPKTIGANNWEKLTPTAVRILSVLMVVLAPFVWLSQFITFRLKRKSADPVLTLADYRALTDLSRQHGVLEASEQHLIKKRYSISRLRNARAKSKPAQLSAVCLWPVPHKALR